MLLKYLPITLPYYSKYPMNKTAPRLHTTFFFSVFTIFSFFRSKPFNFSQEYLSNMVMCGTLFFKKIAAIAPKAKFSEFVSKKFYCLDFFIPFQLHIPYEIKTCAYSKCEIQILHFLAENLVIQRIFCFQG